jgi:fatty acid-binding protein DegV
VAAAAEQVIRRVRLVATVPDLAYLARSGRVPRLAQRVGDRLGVAPLFEFVAGRVRPLRPALSTDAAYARLVQRVGSNREDGAGLHVAAYHAMCPEAAVDLLHRVERLIAPASSFIGAFGSVMVAHTGPGLVGLAWWWEPGTGR